MAYAPRPKPMKRSVTGRAGNYAADVDTSGMDPAMKATLTGTPMTKEEKQFTKGTGRASSVEAVRRARRANKQPLLKED